MKTAVYESYDLPRKNYARLSFAPDLSLGEYRQRVDESALSCEMGLPAFREDGEEEILRDCFDKALAALTASGAREIRFDLNDLEYATYLLAVFSEEAAAIEGIPVDTFLTFSLTLPCGKHWEELKAALFDYSERKLASKEEEEMKEEYARFERTLLRRERQMNFGECIGYFMQKKGILNDHTLYKRCCISKNSFFSQVKLLPLEERKTPQRRSLIAYAIGLRLDLDEVELLYHSAGFQFGTVDFYDRFLRFIIEKKIYSFTEANHYLFLLEKPPLGYVPVEKESKERE